MASPNVPKERVSPTGGSSTLRFWIVSVVILFALAKFLEWLQSFELTMPVLIAGGVLLAIASNYDKRSMFPFWPTSASTAEPDAAGIATTSTDDSAIPSSSSQTVDIDGPAVTKSEGEASEPQLPPFNN